MIGLDTSFVVAFEVAGHPLHDAARALAATHKGEGFCLAPQVLTELVHVITDGRRFERPLAVPEATEVARRWWSATEVSHLYPSDEACNLYLDWVRDLSLGRKRLLDTMLAATYVTGGLSLIATTDWRDFGIYPGLHPLVVS